MTTQRAVVKGQLVGFVETRNMFVCNVVPSGGDTAEVLWLAYITGIYNSLGTVMNTIWTVYQYELQNRSGTQWVPFNLITYAQTGGQTTGYLPNAVAFVLLGKAAGLRHVGRKFFSGMDKSNVIGNSIGAGTLVTLATVLLAYVAPFTGIGGGVITPGILDKTNTFRAFAGGTVSTLLGSMRRRKPGIGI